MTPEQFEHAAEECMKALEEFAFFTKKDNRTMAALGYLKEIVALAKAAIPSGQVAEDVARLHKRLESSDDKAHAAADRLAAQAQAAEVWRKRVEAAADTLADVLPGEAGRLDLLARIAELKRQRDARERDVMVHFEAKNAALGRVAELESALEQEKRLREALKARLTQLSAAGQVLSEHVDKTVGGDRPVCTCTVPAGSPHQPWCPSFIALAAMSEEHQGATPYGWTLRDEFAKAAMQGIRAHMGPDSMSETVAKIAYADADAMLKTKDAK